jgi:hypothetical protein
MRKNKDKDKKWKETKIKREKERRRKEVDTSVDVEVGVDLDGGDVESEGSHDETSAAGHHTLPYPTQCTPCHQDVADAPALLLLRGRARGERQQLHVGHSLQHERETHSKRERERRKRFHLIKKRKSFDEKIEYFFEKFREISEK